MKEIEVHNAEIPDKDSIKFNNFLNSIEELKKLDVESKNIMYSYTLKKISKLPLNYYDNKPLSNNNNFLNNLLSTNLIISYLIHKNAIYDLEELKLNLFNIKEINNFYENFLNYCNFDFKSFDNLIENYNTHFKKLIEESKDLKNNIINTYKKLLIKNIFYVNPKVFEKYSLEYVKLFLSNSNRKYTFSRSNLFSNLFNKNYYTISDTNLNVEFTDLLKEDNPTSFNKFKNTTGLINESKKVLNDITFYKLNNLKYKKISLNQFKDLDFYFISNNTFFNDLELTELKEFYREELTNLISDLICFNNSINYTLEQLKLHNITLNQNNNLKKISFKYDEEEFIKLFREKVDFKPINLDLSQYIYEIKENPLSWTLSMHLERLFQTEFGNPFFKLNSLQINASLKDIVIPGCESFFAPLKKQFLNGEFDSYSKISTSFFSIASKVIKKIKNVENTYLIRFSKNDLATIISRLPTSPLKNQFLQFLETLSNNYILAYLNIEKYKTMFSSTTSATDFKQKLVENMHMLNSENITSFRLKYPENSIKIFGNKTKKLEIYEQFKDSDISSLINLSGLKLNYLSETMKSKGITNPINYISLDYFGNRYLFDSRDFEIIVNKNFISETKYNFRETKVSKPKEKLISKKTLFRSKTNIENFCTTKDNLVYICKSDIQFSNYKSGNSKIQIHLDVLNQRTNNIASINISNLKLLKTIKNVKKKESKSKVKN